MDLRTEQVRTEVDHETALDRHPGSALEVLGVSTRPGLASFGGPIAHLGYFRAEYVARRRWLDEQSYANIMAPC